MICISIAQESRRLVLADMLNASRQCDLIEVRLDRFGKAPEVGELLTNKPKPVIMSCRRPQDGGHWDGSEEERLAILRQCIISKADYVEIELDAAEQIRPFPPAKRVISYTNLDETPADIADVYAEALTRKPDVVKLTTRAKTPEEAWPLVQLLAKPEVPTVVVGLGPAALMLAILGRKIGAPWAYAALERGMESYPEQPTVADLKEIYHYDAIGRATRLIGVTGGGERELATVALLNAALAHHQAPARCLPLTVGSLRTFRRVIDAAKLAAVVVDAEHEEAVRDIATSLDEHAEQARAADLLLQVGEEWRGYHTQSGAVVAGLEALLRTKFTGDQPLQGRIVVVVGTNSLAQRMARLLMGRGAAIVLASRERKAVQQLAQSLGCRFVQFEAMYTTMHDVLLVCEENDIHTGYLRPGMTVVDLTTGLRKSPLLKEAEARACLTLSPVQLLTDRVAAQAARLTRKDTPAEVFRQAFPARLGEEV